MKNWKTTFLGLFGGALTAAATYFGQTGNVTDWKGYAMAATIGALGVAAKDSNVTGGTVVQ